LGQNAASAGAAIQVASFSAARDAPLPAVMKSCKKAKTTRRDHLIQSPKLRESTRKSADYQ